MTQLKTVGRGSTYCFTYVRVGISISVRVTPITKGIFAMTLTFALKGKPFFVRMGFSLILPKV